MRVLFLNAYCGMHASPKGGYYARTTLVSFSSRRFFRIPPVWLSVRALRALSKAL